jgi:prepilin signal peptidase PulO-like enzyme (type II secretory pathway)
MEYLVTLIFSFVGSGIGFLIPNVSNQIIAFKLTQRQKQREKNILDQRKWIILMTIVNGLLWGIVGYFTPTVLTGLLIGCLVTMAIMFTLIDLIIHIIPNEMILAGIVIGTIFQISTFGLNRFWLALVCMVVIVVVFTIVGLIFGLNKIGAGDVKLAGLLGLILSYPLIIYAVMAMSIALIIYSVGGIAIGKLTHVSMFAFAPFLMIGLATGLVFVLFPNLILLII